MSEEEMVPVSLGDDYERGAYFITKDMDPTTLADYLVPRSQVERWEGWLADYGQMQDEIAGVMGEQRERVGELRAARHGPKSPMQGLIEEMYKPAIISALEAPATFRRIADGEAE